MFAIVEFGGRQYYVEPDMSLWIDKVKLNEGEELEFDKVLLFAKSDDEVLIGKPYVENVKVKAQVKKHVKDKKIVAMKYKRKKREQKKYGHRQKYTEVLIKGFES